MSRIYSVPTISCDHCKHAIEGGVRAVEGVDNVEVNVAEKTVLVDGPATDEAIRAAIEEEGYPVAAVLSS